MLKQIVAATVLVAGFSPAHADGLTPAAPAAAGTCYASGSSGPTVPCLQQGATWVQVVRPTDDASTMTTSLAGGGSAALGNTVPTLDIARSEIGSRTIPLRSFVVSGYAAAGDAGAGARYVRGTSTGPMAVQDAAGTWWQLDLSAPVIPAGWFGVVAGDSGKAAQNGVGINAAMAALGARNGGVLTLPTGNIFVDRTLDNRWSNVLVRGSGRRSPFDGPTGDIGTTVIPTSAVEVLRHRTPTAAERGVAAADNWKNVGGGFEDFAVIGNSLSPRLLHVTSINYGVSRVGLYGGVGTENALYDTLPDYKAGTSSQVGSEACNQHLDIDLEIGAWGSTAAEASDGVTFDGVDNSCNSSMIFGAKIKVRHHNGHGVRLVNADNMQFQYIRDLATGSGYSLLVQAGKANVTGNGAIVVQHLTGNGVAHVETVAERPGSDATADLHVIDLDTGNGTPMPTGPNVVVDNTLYPHYASTGKTMAGLALGDTTGAAAAARKFLGANPQYIFAINHSNNGGVAWSAANSAGDVYWSRYDGDSRNYQFFGPGATSSQQMCSSYRESASTAPPRPASVACRQPSRLTAAPATRPSPPR